MIKNKSQIILHSLLLLISMVLSRSLSAKSLLEPENNVFGQKLTWQKVNNIEGELRKFSYPMNLSGAKQCEIKFAFGVKKVKISNTPLAIFNVNGVFDLRITGKEIYLADRKRNKKYLLAKLITNKAFIFKFELNVQKNLVTATYINGKKLTNFIPQKWISKRAGSRITVFGTTKSGIDFYYTKPSVLGNRSDGSKNTIKNSQAPWRISPAYKMLEEKSRVGIFKARWPLPTKVKINTTPVQLSSKKFPVTFYCSAKEWQKFPTLVETDSKALNFWKIQTEYAEKAVKYGGLSFRTKDPQLYIYRLYGGLRILGFVHMFSGNKEVGKLLKALMLDLAKRPIEFWMHSSLRKVDENFPVAALECASITLALAQAYHWNRELFNISETKIILDALRYKGLYPCMRWLEKSRAKSNWLAVIAAGTLAGGRVLEEEQCVKYAARRLKDWTKLVEDDGSYSEPISYFDYGAETFIRGALALGSKESLKLAHDSPLKGSLNYLAYNYTKARTPVNKYNSYRVNFGDGDFPGSPNQTLCMYLAYAFEQGLGFWLMKEYPARKSTYNLFVVMMKLMFKSKSISSVSPEQLKLPGVIFFDNGVGFIRSGWKGKNNTVLALRSGGGGKTQYAHDHQNRNAIMLFKDGEYMITESGRTSYRSPMHYSWDMHTRSSNTITFWDDNQMSKSPAKMLMAAENKYVCYLSSDAYKTYRSNYKVKKACRRILYIKEFDSFVMWDDIVSPGTKSRVNWRMFFNNFDSKTKIEKISDETIIVERKKVVLKVFAQASEPEKYSFGKGWVHTGYCYYPGDAKEGKYGSSLSWTCSNKGKKTDIDFYSFFGSPDCKISFIGNKMTITKEGIEYFVSFVNNEISLTRRKNKNISKMIISDKNGITLL